MADTRTLANLVERIADELKRDDLSSYPDFSTANIYNAVLDAIYDYQYDYFFINDAINTATTTVQGTQLYDLPEDLVDLTVLDIVDTSTVYTTVEKEYQIIDAWDLNALNPTQGVPGYFAIYNGQVRLYPTPDRAYTLRFVYQKKINAPENPTDTNFWTTSAEALIRNRAKYNLNMDVIRDPEAAQMDKTREHDAFVRLTHQSAALLYSGNLKPTQF